MAGAAAAGGRLTDLLRIGKLASDVGLEPIDPERDRFMICGSPSMLKEICALLDSRGFREARHGQAAHYVIERAFVEIFVKDATILLEHHLSDRSRDRLTGSLCIFLDDGRSLEPWYV